jgi:ABC-type glycerol-3-phosphate transport system substrate-binding protein
MPTIPQTRSIRLEYKEGVMNRKLQVVVLTSVMIGALLLAACGAATPEVVEVTRVVAGTPEVVEVTREVVVPGAPEVVTATPEPAPATKPKLTYWYVYTYLDGYDLALESHVRDFAKYKNIDIEVIPVPEGDMVQKWMAGLEARETLPDVSRIYAQYVPQFVEAGALLDITELANKLNAQAGGFWPGAIDNFTVNGKVWGLPEIGVGQPAYVRTDKLAEAGMTAIDTMDQLMEYARKVTVPGEFYGGMGLPLGVTAGDPPSDTRALLWAFGGKEWNEDGTPALESPETLAMLTYIKTMWDEGLMPPDMVNWDNAGNNQCWTTGLCGFIHNTSSIYLNIKTSNPDLFAKTAIIPLPAGPAGRRATMGFQDGEGIFSSTKYPELAKELLDYLYDPDRDLARAAGSGWGWLPIYKSNADRAPYTTDLKPFVDVMAYTVQYTWPAEPSLWGYEVINTGVIEKGMAKMLLEGIDPAVALKDMAKQEVDIYNSYH